MKKFFSMMAVAAMALAASCSSNDDPVPAPVPTPTPTPNPDVTALATPAPVKGEVKDTEFTVSWPAVANAASYTYTVNGANPTSVAGTSATVTGLTAGTEYQFAVKAVSGDATKYSDSAYSATLTIKTTGGTTGGDTAASLKGSAYFPIVLDVVSIENILDKVVADFRPNEETRFLYVWIDTYTAGTAAGLNFFGNTEGYTSLVMGSQGWAGASFCVKDGAARDKLAQIMDAPAEWYLHIGIMSAATDTYAHTIRLTDGSANVDLVLKAGGDYNYTRNGEWQEVEVPMNYFTEKGITYRTGNDDGDFNVIAIVDADNQPVAAPGTEVNYDAIFFYKK